MTTNPNIAALTLDIKTEFSKALGLSPHKLSTDLPFIDMGADSLMLAETLQDINRRYAINLPIVEAYERVNTIGALTQYIQANGRLPKDKNVPPLALDKAVSPEPHIQIEDPRLHQLISKQLELMQKQLALLNSETPLINLSSENEERIESPNFLTRSETESSEDINDRFSSFKIDLKTDKKASEASFIADFAQDYLAHTQRSKSQTQRYRAALSDNRISAGFRPNLKDIIYPVLAEKAKGAVIEDIDGNTYIDFTMGFGVHLFGHHPKFIQTALRKQLETGLPIGPQSPRAGKLAKLICEMTGHDRLTFLNTGGEATMTALRLARASTGKDKLVIFKNSYHGTFDGFLARPDAQSGGSRPASLGTPPSSIHDTYVLDYGTDAALAFIETHADTLAAVMVEPVQSRKPALQPQAFLTQLRDLTQRQNIALIFDEVICGFRCDIGGAQAHFGIKSDLSVYGKVIGGGMPIGIVAGHRSFMDYMDGGPWRYDDDSYPATPTIFHAGTFSKHPLTMAASEAVARRLKTSGPKLIAELNQKTERLAKQLDATFAAEGVDIHIEHFSSLFRFTSPGNLDYFFYRLLQRGIYIWEGRNCFLSTAHKQQHFDALLNAVRRVCQELKPKQLIPLKPRDAGPSHTLVLPLSKSQTRFSILQNGEGDDPSVCNLGFGFLFTTPLNIDRLHGAIKTAIARHDSLNMAYDLSTQTQRRLTPRPDRPITHHLIEEPGTPDLIDHYLRAEQAQILDIGSGENFIAKTFSFQSGQSLLSLCVHHLACDGWGLNVLLNEIADGYHHAADTPPSVISPPQYEIWLKTEDAHQTDIAEHESAAFWTRELKTIPAKRNAQTMSCKPGARLRLSLDPDVSRNYIAKAKREKITLFTSLLSHFQLYLNLIHKGARLPVIGIPFANRTTDTATLVGNCVNLLPFIPEVNETPVYDDILAQTKSKMGQLFRHSKFPYTDICVLFSTPSNERLDTPIDITFNVEPITHLPAFDGAIPDILMSKNGRIEFDQMYNLFIINDLIRLEIDYNPDLYDAIALRGKLNLFCKILETSLR